jgi:AraC-like DNA-binding protein
VHTWRPPLLPGVEMTRAEGDARLWTGHSTRYALSVTEAGAFDFWYRKRVWTQGPGTLKLKEPGEVHRDVRVHAPVTGQTASFAPSLVEDAARLLGLRGPPHFHDAVTRGSGRTEAAGLRLHAALARGTPDRLESESLLAEALESMLVEYAEGTPAPGSRATHPPAVWRAREYLHALFTENVGLEALAHAVGLNRFHLLRQFRAEFGLPPHEYLTHLRVARARVLLAEGVPAGRVAVDVGLYDQSQLNRHFKRIVGLAPGQYARAVRGDAGPRQ